MIIIQDSREQKPWDFTFINPPPIVEISTLLAGDYSLKGYEDCFAIERKSLIDAYGTFGQGRQRFQRELLKTLNYKFFAVIIEADWDTIVKHPPARSRLNPKTVVASIAAWAIRYNVHFYTCPNKEFATRWAYRLLERFYKDRIKEELLNRKLG